MSDGLQISESVPVMPPQARKAAIPYVVSRLLLGATVHENYKGHKDAVALELDGSFYEVSLLDFMFAKAVAAQVSNEVQIGKMVSAEKVLFIHERASRIVGSSDETRTGKGIAMLKDKSGSGYWRMILPARHIDKTGIFVDVTAAALKFDYLLEYATVYVQRLYDWESFYVLEKLKSAGKRIVYDIDDDLFRIPVDNPASRIIGRDEQMAAAACMRLADVVTATTKTLAERIAEIVEREVVVVQNAIDTDDKWLPLEQTGSPDGWKRIFWQGSASHAEDWVECAAAVDVVMQERKDVRMVVLGFLPPVIQQFLRLPHWQGRVEYLGFNDAETYFQLIKHVRADVGLAPLQSSVFNESKSPIKWLEYSMMGIPTVASRIETYAELENCGLLCSDKDDWVDAIMECLSGKLRGREMVRLSREKAAREYDIKKVAGKWRQLLVL